MTPKQEEAVEAFKRVGSVSGAANELGVNLRDFRRLLERAGWGPDVRQAFLLDPAIKDSMAAVGTGLVPALAWAKTKSQDGTSYSVLLKPPPMNEAAILDRIRDAFEGMQAADPVVAPDQVVGDLCSVYPLMDVHLGLHAWGRETSGDDYDIKLALRDMRHAFAKILALTPRSSKGLLIVGGDFFHADNNNSETPASKHKLDTDGRFDKVVEAGIFVLAETIDLLVARHGDVLVRVLRGNHDENAHRILTFALAERYRDEPRVKVEKDPRDLFMFQWGRCAIFAQHGDKAKPQQAALYISDICPFWSSTRHRHYLTGHVHHDQAKDIGPLRWESLRAFCPPDAYAASMGYGARRALQSMTFHKTDGLVLRTLDPIERVN